MLYIENQNKNNRFKLINDFLQINKQNKFSNDKFTKFMLKQPFKFFPGNRSKKLYTFGAMLFILDY